MNAHNASKLARWCAGPVILLLVSWTLQSVVGEVNASRISQKSLQEHAAKLRKSLEGKDLTVAIESPFVLVGDLSEDELRDWAQTVRWAVDRLKAQYFPKPPQEVINVWLLRAAPSYQEHVLAITGKKPTTPFGFYSREHRAMFMDISTGGGTLVHELVHPFIESNFPKCPAWFNEGLASLYEQSRDRRGQIWGLTNWRLKGLKSAIRTETTVPFGELCKTSTQQFYESQRGLYYAQARYLCYYLQEKGLLADFYRQFRDSVDSDPSGFETLQAVLGKPDMLTFQKEWEVFVLELEN